MPTEKLAATRLELSSGESEERASAELSTTGKTMVIVRFLRNDVPHAATRSNLEKTAPRTRTDRHSNSISRGGGGDLTAAASPLVRVGLRLSLATETTV
jgi:hypothetical protein